ncbi:MAG TPA: hypothetical protein VND97_00960 [Beijerinckiaceae bacterium]|nr:hypothetical protein [Beijerinckiaceae bacterium]
MRSLAGNVTPRRSIVAALGLALLLGAAVPARAQFLGYWGWRSGAIRTIVPARTIYRRLEERGYEPTRPLQRNGGVYLADVRTRRGSRQRLVVDAYSGAILQSFSYGPPRPMENIPIVPRGYDRGPAYVSRYPREVEPYEGGPRVIPAPVPHAPFYKKVRRPAHRLAKREVGPATGVRPKAHAPLASHATVEPKPGSSSNAPSRQHKLAAARTDKTNAPASPPSVKPPPEPVQHKGPGYANGVPINPLD